MLEKPLTNKEYMAHGGLNCPYCGKKDTCFNRGEFQLNGIIGYQAVHCDPAEGGCDAEWNDEYRLTGWNPVE
jgi:hypothetical protein